MTRWAVGLLSIVAGALLILPLLGLVVRAPWSQIGVLLRDDEVLEALRLSLVCSLGALALATVLGIPLAYVLARASFRGRALLRSLCLLPMVFPPVVGGVALLLAFGRRGLVGAPVERLTGFALPFTTAGVVVAGTFVAMPFLIISVEAGIKALDRRFEDAAATLGASRSFTFRHVTLPQLAPALGAGMALTWARALGEFGATITFAGNLSGRTQTMPLAVYLQLERDLDVAILLSLVLLVVSVTVLLGVRQRLLG